MDARSKWVGQAIEGGIGMKYPELLVPAGNLEKLRTAILYGADAVYTGVEGLSLRAQQATSGWPI